MDNGAKLTPEQIKSLIEDFKKSTVDEQSDVESFSKKHLTESQAAAFRKLLNNPQLIKSILASDKAKEILKKLKGDENS